MQNDKTFFFSFSLKKAYICVKQELAVAAAPRLEIDTATNNVSAAHFVMQKDKLRVLLLSFSSLTVSRAASSIGDQSGGLKSLNVDCK